MRAAQVQVWWTVTLQSFDPQRLTVTLKEIYTLLLTSNKYLRADFGLFINPEYESVLGNRL